MQHLQPRTRPRRSRRSSKAWPPSKPAWSLSWRAVRRHSDRHVGAPKLMLFDILKLFGLDVRAKIVQARTEFEQRVELAKSRVAHTLTTASVLAVIFAMAAWRDLLPLA